MKPMLDWSRARKSWLRLAQGAVWVGSVLGGFLLPPPVGISATDEKAWLRLGQFIIAVVVGLILLAGRKWHQPKHTLRWAASAVLFLVIGIAAFFLYQQLTLSWTGGYNGARVVTGASFTPQGLAYSLQNPQLSRDALIDDFAGQIENIWTRDSINHRRLILAALYLSCLPLFTICLLAIAQAVQCGGQNSKRRGKG